MTTESSKHLENKLRSFKHECERIAIVIGLAQDCIEDYQTLLGDNRTEESIERIGRKYGARISTMAKVHRYVKDKEKINTTLSTMCIALMYSTWEDKHRKEIAKILGRNDPNEIRCDIMGDLRKIRNYLVHDGKKVGKLEILKDIWEDTGITILEKTLKIIEKIQEMVPNQIQICYWQNIR